MATATVQEKAKLDYYQVLGVARNVDEAEIRKAYLRLAILYHPDKHGGQPEAEERFKQISEAYIVLKDPQKRTIYDETGVEQFQRQQEVMTAFHEAIFTLFGAGKFDDIFGTLSFETLFDPDVMAMDSKGRVESLTKLVNEREKKLVVDMLSKIKEFDHTSRNARRTAKELFRRDALGKASVAGGPALLEQLSYIYKQEAKQHLNRYFGLEKVVAQVQEGFHLLNESFHATSAAVSLQLLLRDNETIETIGANNLKKRIVDQGMTAIWKLGRLEIEAVVRRVCKNVMGGRTEIEISPRELENRAYAIFALGKVYGKVGKNARTHWETSTQLATN